MALALIISILTLFLSAGSYTEPVNSLTSYTNKFYVLTVIFKIYGFWYIIDKLIKIVRKRIGYLTLDYCIFELF